MKFMHYTQQAKFRAVPPAKLRKLRSDLDDLIGELERARNVKLILQPITQAIPPPSKRFARNKCSVARVTIC